MAPRKRAFWRGRPSKSSPKTNLSTTKSPKGMFFGWFYVTKTSKKHSFGCPGIWFLKTARKVRFLRCFFYQRGFHQVTVELSPAALSMLAFKGFSAVTWVCWFSPELFVSKAFEHFCVFSAECLLGYQGVVFGCLYPQKNINNNNNNDDDDDDNNNNNNNNNNQPPTTNNKQQTTTTKIRATTTTTLPSQRFPKRPQAELTEEQKLAARAQRWAGAAGAGESEEAKKVARAKRRGPAGFGIKWLEVGGSLA